jgi:D-alanine-D-alanine ligase
MKRLRVLVLVHPELVPPDTLKGHTEQEINEWKTEYDVASTLREAGHEVRPLGVENELKPIREEIESWKPDVVFNLLEQFHGEAVYDQNVASYLELLRMPYTGCNPRGLVLARGKDLSKKLLIYHRIPLPAFAVFPPRRKIRRPPRLAFPLIVKSLNEDASWGISQASVVDSDEKLAERVSFIHESIGTAAIAEQYIEGRELYVGVLGNERLRVFPIWELEFCSTSSATTSRWARPRTSRRSSSKRSSAQRSASTGRSTSTAMPASISASLPMAFPITSKPTPMPRLPAARSSPRRPSTTASTIPI